MANGWGGKRPGAGRPKGGGRKRLPPEVVFSAAAHYRTMPLERLLARIADESEPARYRDQLCIAVLPFLCARPLSTPSAKASFEMTDEELEAVIAREEIYARGEREGHVLRFPARRRG